MAGKYLAKKKKKKGGGLLLVLVLLLALLAGGYVGLCVWVDGQDMAFPNVTIAGKDVSGLNYDQAVEVARRAVESRQNAAVVTLTCGDWSGQISAADLIPFESYAHNAALKACWQPAGESLLSKGYRYIRHMLGMSEEIELVLNYGVQEQPALDALLDQAAQELGSDSIHADWAVEGEELVMTKGRTDVSIDKNTSALAVFEAMEERIFPALFRGEVLTETVELTAQTVSPVAPDFGAIHTQLFVAPVEPAYDKVTGTVSDHVVGVDFDLAALKTAYDKADEGATFSVPMVYTQPKDTREAYEAKLFMDLLGEGVSSVSGTANRKTNVKLSAAACDGIVLLPGEVFSYNNTTGSRSADKGYLPAPTYNNGASVDDVGGGICQTSSTIYYAVLHTDLKVVERKNHSYATGYVPDGMDATVFFGSLDFRFENSTNYPIMIDTESYDSGGKRYLKVRIYGTNETGRYAVPERIQSDWVEPGKSYLADASVKRGTLVLDTKQNAYTGRKAQVYRYVYEADGTLVEKQDMGVSRYKARDHLYRYNPLDGDPKTWPNGQPPQPAPAEQPTQAPTEAPTQAPAEVPTEVPTQPPVQDPAERPTESHVDHRPV